MRSARLLLGAAFVMMGLLAAPLMSHNASAMIGGSRNGCYADPIVILTDGTLVQMGTFVRDNADDVQQISYTLHIPQGDGVARVLYANTPLNRKETFQFVDDNAPNTYDGETVVTTGLPDVAVTTEMAVTGAGVGFSDGFSGQALYVHLASRNG